MRAVVWVLISGLLAMGCGRTENSTATSSGGLGGGGSGGVVSAGSTSDGSGGSGDSSSANSSSANSSSANSSSANSSSANSSSANSSGGSSSDAGGSGGATAGNTNGSGGATTGNTNGSGGSAGAEPDPMPQACNSSDGSGCGEDEICLDIVTDACAPNLSEDCGGYCAAKLPYSSCEDGVVQCSGSVSCPALPEECPEGLVNSIVDECWGPCVSADCCACTSDQGCWLTDVSCDILAGRCVVPAAPEPRCFLPFDPGLCDGAARVFAFIDGHCQERIWGLCDGNDNRFRTLEECLRRCEGLPQQGECPEGRVAQQMCLECGLTGGCLEMASVCAKSCETSDDCDSSQACSNSTCVITACF